MAYQIDPTKLLVWEAGRPAELWMSHHRLVSEFIEKFRMKPLPMDAYPYYQSPSHLSELEAGLERGDLERTELRKKWIWPRPFPGGIRTPHFHYGRDVYLVERDQWNDFSNQVVKDLQERLTLANEISFEQTLALNEAVTAIR